MTFLSIIIPAYNSEKTIIPLLDSIKKSKGVNFKEIELIIVDDKSTDDTFAILSNLAAGPAARVSQTSLQNRSTARFARGVQGREASFGIPPSRHPHFYFYI